MFVYYEGKVYDSLDYFFRNSFSRRRMSSEHCMLLQSCHFCVISFDIIEELSLYISPNILSTWNGLRWIKPTCERRDINELITFLCTFRCKAHEKVDSSWRHRILCLEVQVDAVGPSLQGSQRRSYARQICLQRVNLICGGSYLRTPSFICVVPW
jgi:hypothetical protein